MTKHPDDWKYPFGRYMPLMVAGLLTLNLAFIWPMGTLARVFNIVAIVMNLAVQAEYELKVRREYDLEEN